MRFKIFVLLLVGLSLLPLVISQSYEDIDDMVNKFASLTQTTLDVFQHLDYVKASCAPFLNLVGSSMGPLFTVLAKTTGLAPDSEELQAIKKLNKAVIQGFGNIYRQQTRNARGIKVHTMKQQYFGRVTNQLTHIKNELNETLFAPAQKNPQKEMADFIDDICKNDNHSPKRILEFVQDITTLSCKHLVVNNETISQAIELYKFFEKIERDFVLSGPHTSSSMNLFKRKKSELIHLAMNNDLANNEIGLWYKKLKRIGAVTPVAFIEWISSELTTEVEDEELCILSMIYVDNNFRRKPIEGLVNIIVNDIKLLEFVAGMCAYLTNINDIEKAQKKTTAIKNIVLTISDSIRLWLNITLESSWPLAYQKVVEELVGEADMPPEKYDETAWTLARELSDNCGSARFTAQVLIVESFGAYETDGSAQYGKNLLVQCEDDFTCFVIKDYKNAISVVVSRFGDDVIETERASVSNEWFASNQAEIVERIKANYDQSDYLDLYWPEKKALYIKNLLDKIGNEVPGVLHSSYYRTRVLIHVNANFESRVVIHYGATNMTVGMDSEGSTNMAEYYEWHALDNDFRIDLFFFL